MDDVKTQIIAGAKQYSDYIVSNIPQKDEEGLVKYYFTGSLAMLLLSLAKSFKPLFVDETGKVVKEGCEIFILNDNKHCLLKGVREIEKDIDVITINELTFAEKGNIYNLRSVIESCDLSTILCPRWLNLEGTMYFDWLSDDRVFKNHNVAKLTMVDGTELLIVDPLNLTIHKFADIIACKITMEKLISKGISIAEKEAKYQKDLRDFASLFNGIVSLYPDVNFNRIIHNAVQSCPDTAFSFILQIDLTDKIDQFSIDILPMINSENQDLFKKFMSAVLNQIRVNAIKTIETT